MEIDVLISTAGEGSRLHKISTEINKSLLPYSNKPIIYHIIEKIPRDLSIGILLGYKSQQVKEGYTIIVR
jgi:dTDP-glucose pyrophosphorylase